MSNNDTEGLQGMKLWKLGEYTTQELKDELERRGAAEEQTENKRFSRVMVKLDNSIKKISRKGHWGHLIDVTDTPAWCDDCEEWFDL